MKKIKTLLILIAIICLPLLSLADGPGPPPPPGNGGPGGGGTPVGAPIDGGLGILVILAASAVYGGYKIYQARKEENEHVPED